MGLSVIFPAIRFRGDSHVEISSMKSRLVLSFAAVLMTGCATSTIESRKAERYNAYNSLAAEQKESIDQGQIKIGMSMDAVYIAWGKPSQVLASETSSGPAVVWLYSGSYLQGFTTWNYPGMFGPYHRYYYGPILANDYTVINYVSAEVVFDGGGLVKAWRQLPRPGG
jgi:hypothetical protein